MPETEKWTPVTDQAIRSHTGTHVEVVGSELIVHCGERHAAVIPVDLLEQLLRASKQAPPPNTSNGVLDDLSSLNTFRSR